MRSRPLPSNVFVESAQTLGITRGTSRITALNIEFVAKPNEAHKVQVALPSAIHGALGEVTGFAGSFVLVSNHEARLVTVVTLWAGEDRVQRSQENLRWVRALVAPYLDRCLRVQTQSAFVPEPVAFSRDFEQASSETGQACEQSLEEVACVA
jgi:hypothetical protein